MAYFRIETQQVRRWEEGEGPQPAKHLWPTLVKQVNWATRYSQALGHFSRTPVLSRAVPGFTKHKLGIWLSDPSPSFDFDLAAPPGREEPRNTGKQELVFEVSPQVKKDLDDLPGNYLNDKIGLCHDMMNVSKPHCRIIYDVARGYDMLSGKKFSASFRYDDPFILANQAWYSPLLDRFVYNRHSYRPTCLFPKDGGAQHRLNLWPIDGYCFTWTNYIPVDLLLRRELLKRYNGQLFEVLRPKQREPLYNATYDSMMTTPAGSVVTLSDICQMNLGDVNDGSKFWRSPTRVDADYAHVLAERSNPTRSIDLPLYRVGWYPTDNSAETWIKGCPSKLPKTKQLLKKNWFYPA